MSTIRKEVEKMPIEKIEEELATYGISKFELKVLAKAMVLTVELLKEDLNKQDEQSSSSS